MATMIEPSIAWPNVGRIGAFQGNLHDLSRRQLTGRIPGDPSAGWKRRFIDAVR